ncbi:MAG: hypothetical protein OXT67_07145 [Zetaproteobacteria bacterium]|nr:hypothetical protein [Zetaproteobacteria bacterium]
MKRKVWKQILGWTLLTGGLLQCNKRKSTNFDNKHTPQRDQELSCDSTDSSCQGEVNRDNAWLRISIAGYTEHQEKYHLTLHMTPYQTWDVYEDQTLESSPMKIGSEYDITVETAPKHPVYQEAKLVCTLTKGTSSGTLDAQGPHPIEVTCNLNQPKVNHGLEVQVVGLSQLGQQTTLKVVETSGAQLSITQDGSYYIREVSVQSPYQLQLETKNMLAEKVLCTTEDPLAGTYSPTETQPIRVRCELAEENTTSALSKEILVQSFGQSSSSQPYWLEIIYNQQKVILKQDGLHRTGISYLAAEQNTLQYRAILPSNSQKNENISCFVSADESLNQDPHPTKLFYISCLNREDRVSVEVDVVGFDAIKHGVAVKLFLESTRHLPAITTKIKGDGTQILTNSAIPGSQYNVKNQLTILNNSVEAYGPRCTTPAKVEIKAPSTQISLECTTVLPLSEN